MKVEHFGGTIVDSVEALETVLRERYGDDANELWMTHGDGHPLLTILVRDSVSCLHYFPWAGHPGFISVGDRPPSEALVFFTNTPSEQIEVPSEAVVPFEQAAAAARGFFLDDALPATLRWREL